MRLLTVAAVLAVGSTAAYAQQMDPRAYANVPVGLNFLIAGYGHSQGDVLLDPSVPVENAQAKIDTMVLGYARSIAVFGQSGTLAVAVPYASIFATGQLDEASSSVRRSGFGDAALRMTVNLYGAPALSLQDFRDYRQDLIIGASLLVSAPSGRYDPSKLVNIGTNRWTVKPELGISQALGRWTLEAAAGVTFFTDNDQYLGTNTRKQEPLYAAQGHVIYNFPSGIWGSLDTTYYVGGRTSVNDGLKNDLQQTWRWGATVSVPVNRANSIKLYVATGASSRAGTDFDTFGVAWQYYWGGGR